jgi:glycosyltransferase involved in cell wall biosynthesis
MTGNTDRVDDPPRLRVVHLFRSPVGGLFRHVCDLARAQSESGAHVGIICDASTGGAAAAAALESLDELCELGVRRVPMKRTPGLSDLLAVRAIRPLLAEITPDIIHGHGAKGAAYGRLLARRLDSRAVFTPHGGVLHYSEKSIAGRVYIALERALKSRTGGVIFESQFARQGFLDKIGAITFPERVIYNGLYEHEYVPVSRDGAEFDFVFVGELRDLKGIYELVEATAAIRQTRPVSLLMVGAGAEEANLRRRIDELGLTECVSLSPPTYPATRAFARARCVVVPSLHESFPYVVLESLAAGMPIVTTRVGGIPEMFGDFADQLIEPGDPVSLRDAMASILDDPQSTEQRALSLHSYVRQRFRVESMSKQTVDFYESIIGGEEGGST